MVALKGRDYGWVPFLRKVETTDELRRALDEMLAEGENADLADTYIVRVCEVALDPGPREGLGDPVLLIDRCVSIRPIREPVPTWQEILRRGDPDRDER
jgi:hypothetical protein